MSFEAEWARCGPLLAPALDRAGPTHTLADVEAMIRAREARLWAGRRAALVTCIEHHPHAKVLLLWLAGGDLTELVDELRPAAEAYGRAEGCATVIIVGRAGWTRALAPHAYRETARLLEKPL